MLLPNVLPDYPFKHQVHSKPVTITLSQFNPQSCLWSWWWRCRFESLPWHQQKAKTLHLNHLPYHLCLIKPLLMLWKPFYIPCGLIEIQANWKRSYSEKDVELRDMRRPNKPNGGLPSSYITLNTYFLPYLSYLSRMCIQPQVPTTCLPREYTVFCIHFPLRNLYGNNSRLPIVDLNLASNLFPLYLCMFRTYVHSLKQGGISIA